MTSINRLTTKPNLEDLDFIPIWDSTSGRTRNIQAESIKTFISDLIPDNDPVVGGSINEGQLTLHTKSGQDIEVGSVSGVMVESDFVNQVYVDGGIQALIEDGAATLSQNITKSIWPIQTLGIGESPLSIDSPEQYGIDYEFSYNGSTVMNPSVLLFNAEEGAQIKVSTFGMAKESKPVTVSQLTSGEQKVFWYVTTPTVFMFHEDQWRVEESSQLTHIENSTTFDSPAAKTPVIGVAAKPGSAITTEVTDGVLLIGGGVGQDINLDDYQRKDDPAPNYKRYDIDTAGSGQANFTASIHQDNEIHTVIDATRELRINYKDIGTGSITAIAGFDNNQAQFLVPIYQGNDAVALAKDLPNTDNFIQKHTNAELNHLEIAYQGKYGENRVHYPCKIEQGSSGRTNFDFTRELQFNYKNPSSGSRDSTPILSLSKEDVVYTGDTTQPTNLVTREALEESIIREWFFVANGTLVTNGNRPTGGAGSEGELNIWHNVTSDSTTDPANEFKVLFEGAYSKVNNFTKPLRYRLSQQGGSRNQYWDVLSNGWETNDNVWHLSAVKVTGDNLVVGIDTEVYASFHFIGDDNEDSEFSYHGQGLGVPEGEFLVTGTINQSSPVGLYYNALNDGSSRGNIELNSDEGYNEFQVIIQGLNKATRSWRIGTGTPGRYSDKTIRMGETWICRVYVDWQASSNTNFFWARIDDGTSSFDAIDTSSFDADAKVEILKKTFENKDLISIPIEMPEGFEILVSSVICKIDGKLRKQPFEYQYENGILRVHLNEVCSGIIIAEMIK